MAVLVNGELVLYGFVGDNYWDQGFTSREVIDALAEIGRDADVNVRINSGGGYVDDGVAIFNALSQHKGKVTVIVDAMAASSASVIAMAGDERIMRKGAMMMIHDPASVVWGTAEDMAKAIKMLEKHAASLASIYADVTGEDVDDIRSDMKDELWLTAEEAVERGFATSANDNKAKPAAAHDYSVYANAPQRLVALSGKKNWSHNGTLNQALASTTAANPSKQERRSMPNDNPAAINDADNAVATATKNRIKAIVNSDDAKGREVLANHFAFETDMTPEAAIAALKLAAPTTAAATTEPTYEERRMAAAALAQPNGGGGGSQGKPAANINANAIYASRRQQQGK